MAQVVPGAEPDAQAGRSKLVRPPAPRAPAPAPADSGRRSARTRRATGSSWFLTISRPVAPPAGRGASIPSSNAQRTSPRRINGLGQRAAVTRPRCRPLPADHVRIRSRGSQATAPRLGAQVGRRHSAARQRERWPESGFAWRGAAPGRCLTVSEHRGGASACDGRSLSRASSYTNFIRTRLLPRRVRRTPRGRAAQAPAREAPERWREADRASAGPWCGRSWCHRLRAAVRRMGASGRQRRRGVRGVGRVSRRHRRGSAVQPIGPRHAWLVTCGLPLRMQPRRARLVTCASPRRNRTPRSPGP